MRKLRLKKTSYKSQIKFLSERLYLSDQENRTLMIKIDELSRIIDGKDDRHDRLRISKIEEIDVHLRIIEDYKVTIMKFQAEIVELEEYKKQYYIIRKEHDQCPIDIKNYLAEISKLNAIIESLRRNTVVSNDSFKQNVTE